MSDDSSIHSDSSSRHIYIPSLHFPRDSQSTFALYNSEDKSRLSDTDYKSIKNSKEQLPLGDKDDEDGSKNEAGKQSKCCILI